MEIKTGALTLEPEERPEVRSRPTGQERSDLDRFLCSLDHNYLSTNLSSAKDICSRLALTDYTVGREYWESTVAAIGGAETEEDWDDLLPKLYSLLDDVLRSHYNPIMFFKSDGVRVAEFLHRLAIFSFLEDNQNEAQRSERMENLLGTTQSIFLEGHQNAMALHDREATLHYRLGLESFLNILASCRTEAETKNAVLALFEVAPSVDWEAEQHQRSILGAMARYNIEQRNYDYDDNYQPPNAYIEAAQIGLHELINKNISLNDKEGDCLIHACINSTERKYLPPLAEIASKNPDTTIKPLLDIIRNPRHEIQSHIALSLLYRLELGRVGISEEGLNYLGRRFDLGEYNNPHNFAQRITADGKVGIFGPNRSLEGFVQLDAADFSADATGTHRQEVLDITYEMLFTPRPDETDHERAARERILADFKVKYFDTYLGMFASGEQQHGLHFNNLSLPEQGFVLQFLTENQGNRALRDRFFQFLGHFGENGFFAFRSSEFNPEAAEKILNLAQTERPEYLEDLFDEYHRTYELAGRVANHIMRMLQGQENALEINLIRENILMLAQQFLNEHDEEEMGLMYIMSLNAQLREVLRLPPTIDGFIEGQMYLSEFLADNMPRDSRSPEYLAPSVIAGHLQRLYDNPEFVLRDFEGKTTDTSISFQHLLDILAGFQLQATAEHPEELKIYDVGAGEGRIAALLSKEGYRVVGIDISPRMVAQVPERVTAEEGDPAKIDIREGDFFNFDSAKFDEAFGPEKADVAIIMWHTFGFAGDHQGQMRVLKNICENLRPGGKVVIEMPDRNFGGYARALRQYHTEHPETPFGTLVDAPSQNAVTPSEQNQAISSPRYFPANEELKDLLEEAGFNLPHFYDYFVRAQNESGQTLAIKENLFVAEKPLDAERFQKLKTALLEKS